MLELSTISWLLIVFGVITCMPLLMAQLIILMDPEGQRAKDILIGKGKDWRDKSHFKSAYALAVADWIIFFPVFATAIAGMLMEYLWAYLLFAVSGAIQLYINFFLWFFEKEHVYPSLGPFKYYTYCWGNFVYWGAAALVYGLYIVAESMF